MRSLPFSPTAVSWPDSMMLEASRLCRELVTLYPVDLEVMPRQVKFLYGCRLCRIPVLLAGHLQSDGVLDELPRS